MNREQHLQWAKARALEYVQMGELQNALMSLILDLGKHDETRALTQDDAAFHVVALLMSNDRDKVREYIKSFN